MDNNVPSSGPPERSPLHHNRTSSSSRNNLNGNATNHHQHHQQSANRPQTLTPTRGDASGKPSMPMQGLVLTVNKDANGYGMKVSGDKPVFVESVKPGGAAQKAGLMAEDMILKVNGTNVRSSTHTEVVELIKASDIVELTVQRSHNKMQRPSPSTTSITPTTPIAPRNSITAPVPVDHAKQREMDIQKIKTLQLMLEQERKNLGNLYACNKQGTSDAIRSETNIRTLEEQLAQTQSGEDTSYPPFSSVTSPLLFQQPPPQITSTPAFLSRFPRSLSSLSLGTKKKSTEKDTGSPNTSGANLGTPECLSPTGGAIHGSIHGPFGPAGVTALSSGTPTKKKYSSSSVSDRNHKHQQQHQQDTPPPLPQRNIPKRSESSLDSVDTVGSRRNIVVSDLDHSVLGGGPGNGASKCVNNNNTSVSGGSKSSSSSSKSRKKKNGSMAEMKAEQKTMYHHGTERGGGGELQAEPPPLPPRQPGMMEVNQNLILNNDNVATPIFGGNCNSNTNNNNSRVGSPDARPPPNSINTLMSYPLVSTITPVRDSMASAFPFSQRLNIVQQMQQAAALNATPPSAHINQSINKKHRRIVSSPENISAKEFGDHSLVPRHQKTSSDSWDKRSHEITPPGTPPPPYPSSSMLGSGAGLHHDHTTAGDLAIASGTLNLLTQNQLATGAMPPTATTTAAGTIMAAQPNVAQKPIISMEDDETSDQESFIEEHGPFRSLSQLQEPAHSAHLAVFLNFLLSNSDPSPLLFYLITALYKEGSIKDMRKWAYEIHSTFLVPGAPLLWPNVDESLAREIDDILQKENDKVEFLRRVFFKSRNKARDYINIQLQEFQVKRTAGLGTMYGPTDQQLQNAKGDKVKEQRIVEETLLPKLQQYLEEIEKGSPKECLKKQALCSALSTVIQRFFVTRSNPGSPIDKVHHFVSREKSFKSRLMAKNRKQDILGHNLRLQPYYEVTRCNHCQNILWGVSPQGYHCSNCELNIHRTCAKDLKEECPGPAQIPKNDGSKITKLMEKISSRNHHQADKTRKHDDDAGGEDGFSIDRPNISLVRQPSDRRQDLNNSSYLGNTSSHSDYLSNSTADPDTFASQGVDHDQFRDSVKSKSAPVSVNRSESYKERSQKKNRNTRRKTSDPSLTKTTDEQNEASSLINNYSSSSTSSLPLGLESRSTSLEAVGGGGVPVGGSSAGPGGLPGSGSCAATAANVSSVANNSALFSSPGGPANVSNLSGLSGFSNLPPAREWVDSEDEGNFEPEADWSSNISAEILATLCDAEKKRQEVINEIYQTERNHVRTLRLLEGIFMRPLQDSGALPGELLQLLFPPSLRRLQELHTTFESNLKVRRAEHCHVVREIGDLLMLMFDGQSGEDLKEHAAYFCARQQIALEALKERRKKDETLHRLLMKAESHKACRRLQLKDLLPTVLQRLTKYPLLFDNLYNFTVRVHPDNEIEAQAIKKALESSKRILDHVNQAVRQEEDSHKLITIQRKLDKSGLDKDASSEFRNIDLTVRKLIHDGPLTMKKNPGVQLHGLLFEDMMVLLQKQDDKYLLKYHSSPGIGGNESKITEGRFNPITRINLILVRQSAVDKNTFFLINTNVSQMLELTAPSSSECKTWFKHISDAADAYKARTKGSHEYSEDPAAAGGHPPKDTFETVTESQKIEQISTTPLDRLERKDSSQQCRAVSTGGPASIGHSTSNVSTGSAGSGTGNNNNEDSLPNKNRTANESDDNAENEEKEKFKRRSQYGSAGSQDYPNGPAGASDDDQKPNDDEDGGPPSHHRGRGQGCALTQQCSLVAPSEIHVSVSNALTAEPILAPKEKLRRLDQVIRTTLVEKQRVVCDMFRVPDEHFLAIADIAGQPEAPQKEPSDIILAAFAHIQSLTGVLNEHMRVSQGQEIAAVSATAAVCDECHRKASAASTTKTPELNGTGPAASEPSVTGGVPPIASVLDNDQVNITEDEDGYCEIDEVRAAAVLLESQLEAEKLKKLAAEASEASNPLDDSDGQKSADSHIEVNENYDSSQNHLQPSSKLVPGGGVDLCGRNRLLHASALAPSIPCHLIASYVTGLNAQISQLLPKISERDLERETLRRENQHLRELLNEMHQKRVLESQETTEAPVTDPESQPTQQQSNNPQLPAAAATAAPTPAAATASAAVPATAPPTDGSSSTVVNE